MYNFKTIKFLLLYFISFGITILLKGQNPSFEFDHYTTNNGLSFGFTNCIFQDSRGFIWIATGRGLNRFDGLTFKVYLFDSKDPKSLPGNVVMDITEDSLENIWLATHNSLALYNRGKDNFSKIIFIVNDTIRNDIGLTSCFIDSKGYMWLGAYRGIYRFKLYNNQQVYTDTIEVERFFLNEKDVNESNKTTVYTFIEDEKNRVWVASYSKYLFCFDEPKKEFIPYLMEHPEANNFSNTQKSLIRDNDGDFLITIEFNGLLVWNRKDDIFKLYKPNGTNTGPNDNLLYAINQASDGLIWIGGRNQGGINIFNKKTGTFFYVTSDPSNPYSLSTNSLSCFLEDRDGITWVGTGSGKGLEKYSPLKKKFTRYFAQPNSSDGPSNNNVLCFAESKSGDIWVGTDGFGLNKLNRKTGKFKHYVNDPDNPNSLSSNSIISLCEDHEGVLWIATFNGGLCRLEGDRFTTYLPDPNNPFSITYQHIWYVFEDSKQNLWVATLNRGLLLLDRKTNRFYSYIQTDNVPTSLINNGSFQIYEDSKQNLYITGYGGVSKINLNDYDFSKLPPDLKFQRYFHIDTINSISSSIVYCVAEDLKGNIWFGTQATGMDKMDPSTGKFTNYSTHNGLPGNLISSILVDNKNILWLATDRGLAKLNPETGEVYVFDEQDGLLNKSLKGWAIKTKDGEMFFGGPDGFNSFYPSKIQYNKSIPPVVITGLRLFNQPVKMGDTINNRVLLENDIIETKRLVFYYDEDFISFEFVALNFTVSERNKYAYKMEGFDKEWIYCGTKREASYTNLDPGKYIFKVKASNNDGIWNEEGVSLEIVILPPWWKTLWFRLIAIAIFILLITYIIIRIIRRLIQAANQTILDERNQLKTLINNMPDIIFIKDTKLRFLVINEAAVNFMDGKNEEYILNKTNLDIYPNEIAEQYNKEEMDIISTGIPMINKESSIIKNNKTQILSTTKCALINTIGETIGLVGIISDITEKKITEQKIIKQREDLILYNEQLNETNAILEERQMRIEEQAEELSVQAENLKDANILLFDKQQLIQKQAEKLQETNDQLTILNATKDRFFSIIAHDLRNPFNALMGFSELLLKNIKRLPDEKIQNYLHIINESSKSGNNLLENLLQWSRAQTGRISFKPVKVKLKAIIEETYDLLSGMAHEKKLTLDSLTDSNVTLLADENMVKTIVRNLVSNAMKFTPVNGHISIKAVIQHSMVEITVADTGVGISEENQKKLFRIDTIVSTTGTANEKGTGLGLLLCKEFIEKHGGKIWVESDEGKGSKFKFTLPLHV